MWCHVELVGADVSEECVACIFCELEMFALTTRRRNSSLPLHENLKSYKTENCALRTRMKRISSDKFLISAHSSTIFMLHDYKEQTSL
jgi:hypothetical protein